MRKTLFGCLMLCVSASASADVWNDSITLNPVVVEGLRLDGATNDSPQFVSRIGAARIAQTNPQTAADMLAADGLLTVQKSQQGGGSPSLRGFESSRVLLVVDGVRMNNLIYRAGHLQNVITIDPAIIESAAVLFGPASVGYGSDALGGVVSFRTKAPRTADNGLTFSGSAFSRYASANDGTSLHADFNIGGTRFASFTSLSFNRFGDLRAGRSSNPFMPDGDGYIHRPYTVEHVDGKDIVVPSGKTYRQPGSAYQQYDLMQKFLFRSSDRVRHLLNFQFSNTGDIPRYDRLTDLKGSKPKFAQWYYGPQQRLMASYNLSTDEMFGADRANLILAYQNIKESRHNRKLNDPWLGSRCENVDMFILNTDWVRYLGAHSIHAGIDGALQFLKSTAHRTDIDTGEVQPLDTRYPDGHNHMHNIDLFVTHTWDITPRLTLSDGARVGYSSLVANFVGRDFFPLFAEKFGKVTQNNATYSLSAGLTFSATDDWRMAFSLASAYRVPDIDDLGKVFDSQPGMVVIPNPHIRPEKTISADFNVAHINAGIVEWEASVFGSYIFDAIALAPATLDGKDKIDYDGELSDVFANRNNRSAWVAGITSSIRVNFLRYFRADATATYTYGDILSTNGEEKMPLDHVAPLFGRVGLTFDSSDRRTHVEFFSLFNGRKPLSRYNLNGEDNIGYATLLGTDGKGLPAWFTLNLRASYTPHPCVTLQGGIDNILDTEYRTFASGINAPGRNFTAAIRVSF